MTARLEKLSHGQRSGEDIGEVRTENVKDIENASRVEKQQCGGINFPERDVGMHAKRHARGKTRGVRAHLTHRPDFAILAALSQEEARADGGSFTARFPL